MNKPKLDRVPGDLIRKIQLILEQGPDLDGTEKILSLLGCPPIDEQFLAGLRIYSDFLPRAADYPFSPEQRYLHVLWDAFDRSLFSLSMTVAFPLRRMIAKRLFRHCGKNFTSEGEVRFNFGQFLSVGDDVFFNRGSFIDTKGGVTIGDAVGIGEFVRIFTHTHSESLHSVRTYSPVTIKEYAKIFSGAMILPGVTIGRQAIVAGGAVVTTDVPENSVVAGVPARVIRERRTEGRTGADLDHVWLHRGAFQDE
ncbi:MAG: galactoside O-acetyltransferase [Euryarchaeota archaeon ADurb.BinA087]|nr:MAG: galactoside O-acetyltransferase [Euryarchaeota archaeon ADurb.BinA087]